MYFTAQYCRVYCTVLYCIYFTVKHFTFWNHSLDDMSVVIIEASRRNDPVLQKIWGSKWIRLLETSHPTGMNFRVDNL